MSEEPKKEKKKAVDYAGIAALVTAIPTALATFYGIMSFQQKVDQKGTETKQYSTVLNHGTFNAQSAKIDGLKDKHTDLAVALAELNGELKLLQATCECGNKNDKSRPKAAKRKPRVERKPAASAPKVAADKPECMTDEECGWNHHCYNSKCVPRPQSAMPPPDEEVSEEAMPEPAPPPDPAMFAIPDDMQPQIQQQQQIPSFEQIQEQAEEGEPWVQDQIQGQEGL
jgi:hypothetical protein